MSDPFIDKLYGELEVSRGLRDAASARAEQRHGRYAAARAEWWDRFVDVLGQKVGAWNERNRAGTPVNFTKAADGSVHVSHPNAELTLRLEGDKVFAKPRFGDARTAAASLIQLTEDARGQLRVMADEAPVESPSAAAEKILQPILVKTFA
jgi:hypothetical protein